MKIDKIYVIALDHSPESIQSIVSRLNGLGIPGTGYDIRIAHDGKKDPLPEDFNLYAGWMLPESENGWWNRELTPGEIGCTISHTRIWEDIIDKGFERVLVLEEDFLPLRRISELSEDELSTEPWDICYLGRNKIDDSIGEEQISKNFVIPSASYNSHAYLLSNSGAEHLLNAGIKESVIPIDEYLIACQGLSHREDLNNIVHSNISAISTIEEWIKQTSTPANSTVGHAKQVEDEPDKEEAPYFEILDTRDWDAWLDKYVNQTIRKGEYDLIVDEIEDTNILEFPLFTEKFCREAIALANSKNKWTIDRHEFYPTNDVLLPELGLDEAYNRVINEIVRPLCNYWWHLEGNLWESLKSENFMARYTTDRQSHLSLHHDFSHITMVLKLNDEFDGGGTWFPKYKVLSNPERIGTATLHPGMVTHRHGARPILAGERYIAVSFMRQSN